LTPFRLLDTGHISAAENMALDKIILDEVAECHSPPTLRFLQFKPSAALVGYHQDVDLEIRHTYCQTHRIDINRRLTGGGSILFQESAIGWEVFGSLGQEPFIGSYEAILNKICNVAASGISRLGVSANFRPRNDIEVNGRKISGTGGVTVSGGFMFQGTLLVQNEVELFLKALRVPVEKLKKREIESLMERICFLSDLVRPLPPSTEIKKTISGAFAEELAMGLIPGGLTDRELNRLQEELPYFKSPKWVRSRSRPASEGEPIRSIFQTRAGTLRVHLWVAPGGKRVRQALIVGDFFTTPGRLVHDLEACLVGAPIERTALKKVVLDFFSRYDGSVLGIRPDQVAEAVAAASDRLLLMRNEFTRTEVNDLFLVNLAPDELAASRPKWLLLPYCSKNTDCEYRKIPGCSECGACEIGECFDLARSMDMTPITVQSFEHLMEVLSGTCSSEEGMYIGSCCEAFYSKHQNEMEDVRAKGVLVNLDSTTCYDLGKGTNAYKGDFENKTSLNLSLITKILRHLHGPNDSV
jgi:lipoate---protein ligase